MGTSSRERYMHGEDPRQDIFLGVSTGRVVPGGARVGGGGNIFMMARGIVTD